MQKVSYYATTTTLSGITWAKAIIGIRVHGQLSGVNNSIDFTVDNVDAQGQKLLPCVDTTLGSGAAEGWYLMHSDGSPMPLREFTATANGTVTYEIAYIAS